MWISRTLRWISSEWFSPNLKQLAKHPQMPLPTIYAHKAKSIVTKKWSGIVFKRTGSEEGTFRYRNWILSEAYMSLLLMHWKVHYVTLYNLMT